MLPIILLFFLINPNLCASRRVKDPDVQLDIIPSAPKKAPLSDYGDYEDYELTTRAPIDELIMEIEKHDELAKLMTDLHKEERVSQRTTVTKEDMMTSTVATEIEEEEGSGDEVTTKQPQVYTTVMQEVKNVPSTLRPDPYENIDYDLSDHSNSIRRPAPKIVGSKAKVAARPKQRLHGGDVAALKANGVKANGGKKYLKKVSKIDKRNKLLKLNGKLYRIGPKMKLKKITSRGRVSVNPEVFSTNVIAKKTKKNKRINTTRRPIANRRRKRQVNDNDDDDNDFQELEPQQFIYQELTQVEPSHIVYEMANELVEPKEEEQEEPEPEPVEMHSGLAQVNLVGTLNQYLRRRYSVAG